VLIIQCIEIQKIEELMQYFERQWLIAGGWTIDLAIGEETRKHKDMDICIFRDDLEYSLKYFRDWDIHVAIPGEHRLEPLRAISDIELPRYCLHLFKGDDFLEILATEQIESEIIYRKDRSITMNKKDFVKGDINRPYVNPAWQLLFKSQITRKEDEHDFHLYMNRVKDDDSKKWLLQNIIKVNGNKNWIEELACYFREDGDIP
jgi:hypothetical protein